MINEETSNKTLHMEMQAAKVAAKGIEKLVKDLLHKLDQQKQSLDSYLKNSSKEVTMKDSVIQSIDKYKQAMKDTVTKDKVKNKQKEQSL